MRPAALNVLKALYQGIPISASKGFDFGTTRITNEISTIRNKYDIGVITERVDTSNGKWFGVYRLERTSKNLERVRKIIEQHSQKDEVQESRN